MALIVLDNTTPYAVAIRRLEVAGARMQHVFPPNVLIGQTPPNLTPDTLELAGVAAIYREPADSDALAAFGPAAQKAGRVWNDLLAALTPPGDTNRAAIAQAADDLVGDALIPPDLPPEGQSIGIAGTDNAPGYYQTSEFMIGSVAVGIILPESDGSSDPSTEDWTEEERSQVFSEVIAATNWWAAREPIAHLTFVYDDHASQPLLTSYEPISRPQSDQGLWIGEVMGRLGYDGSPSYFTRVRDYVNNLRITYQTDWAFAVFVVDSSNDSDNYFATGYFAYAYLGGPFTVMTYGNNGYGIHNMDAVAAHEIGHVFLALDQYSAAHVACTTRAGYLDVENQNSLYGSCTSNVPSIMRGQVWPYTSGAIDHYARGQIGWWDSDDDGLLEPIDTSTEVTLMPESEPEAGQSLHYTGVVRDIPCPSPRRHSTTINHITDMAYRLEGNDWQPVSPTDGRFDSVEETINFTLPPLTEGIYQLDLLIHTSLGGNRIVSPANVVVIPAPDSKAPVPQLQEYVPDPTTDNTPTYAGLAAAIDSTVAAVEFRVDGGNWQPTLASDGHFDEAIETFNFTTPALDAGLYTIEVRATDAMGQTSCSCSSDSIEIRESYPVFLPLIVNDQ